MQNVSLPLCLAAVDFSAANLAYGMTMHNRTVRLALQAALERVMY